MNFHRVILIVNVANLFSTILLKFQSQSQARQSWPYMNAKLRANFQSQLEEHSNTFQIENVFVNQFHRVVGYNTLLSAHDVTLAAAALLEQHHSSSSHRSAHDFNAALDALDTSHVLNEGMDLAKTQLQNLHATASLLIERNGIVRLSHFRYAHVSGEMAQGSGGALGLRRLAAFLMDMHRTNGSWTGAKALPLVLLLESQHLPYTLISAHNYSDKEDQSIVASKFHTQLRLTADSIAGCRMELDGFDGCVIRVHHQDSEHGNMSQRFVEQLHYLMDAV